MTEKTTRSRADFIQIAQRGLSAEKELITLIQADFPASRASHILQMRDLATQMTFLTPETRENLILAVLWHDLGYHPTLAQTGFHSADGATLLSEARQPELAAAVACHSTAPEEASSRGLPLPAIARTDVADLLTYLDMHVKQGGGIVCYEQRVADIVARYGEGTPVALACRTAQKRLTPLFTALEKKWPPLLSLCQKACEKTPKAVISEKHPTKKNFG